MLEWVFLAINIFLVAYSWGLGYVTLRRLRLSDKAHTDLTSELAQMHKMQMKLTELEAEFVDKFDYAMKKWSNRHSMRRAREEDAEEESIKSPIVGM